LHRVFYCLLVGGDQSILVGTLHGLTFRIFAGEFDGIALGEIVDDVVGRFEAW